MGVRSDSSRSNSGRRRATPSSDPGTAAPDASTLTAPTNVKWSSANQSRYVATSAVSSGGTPVGGDAAQPVGELDDGSCGARPSRPRLRTRRRRRSRSRRAARRARSDRSPGRSRGASTMLHEASRAASGTRGGCRSRGVPARSSRCRRGTARRRSRRRRWCGAIPSRRPRGWGCPPSRCGRQHPDPAPVRARRPPHRRRRPGSGRHGHAARAPRGSPRRDRPAARRTP